MKITFLSTPVVRSTALFGFILLFAVTRVQATQDSLVPSQPQKKISIKAGGPTSRIVSVFDKALVAQYEKFFREHPEIEVISPTGLTLPESPNSIGGEELMAIAGGTAPDVLGVSNLRSMVDQQFLYPLDEFIEAEVKKNPDFIKSLRIPDSYWPALRYNGHIWGLVSAHKLWCFALVYRKDLMREVGLVPRAPTTMDEFFYFCQRLTNRNIVIEKAGINDGSVTFKREGRHGFGIMGVGSNTGFTFMNFVYMFGGDVVRQYKVCPSNGMMIETPQEEEILSHPGCPDDLSQIESRWKAAYAGPEGIEALNFFKKLKWSKWTRCKECNEPVNLPENFSLKNAEPLMCPKCGVRIEYQEKEIYEGVVRLCSDFPEIMEGFLNGKIAMLAVPPSPQFLEWASIVGLRKDEIGIASFPKMRGKNANILSGDILGINASQKDPRVRQAAWEWLKYMCSDAAVGEYVRVMVENGNAHLVKPEDLFRFGYQEYYEQFPVDSRHIYEDLLKDGRSYPFCEGARRIEGSELPVPIGKVLDDAKSNPEALLKESERLANERVFKVITPEEMSKKRWVAGIAIFFVVIFIVYIFYQTIKGNLEKLKETQKLIGGAVEDVSRSYRKHISAWAFMLPALVTIFLWQYVPLVRGSVMAFFDYRLVAESRFIGIDNFIYIFNDPHFYYVMGRTFYYVFLSLVLGFAAPIILALFLSEIPKLQMLFRTIYYLPAVTTGLVVILLWKWIYNPTEVGLLNTILGWVGLPEQHWLHDPTLAMFCVIIPGVWGGVGPGSILYLAAFKTIPEQLYEAVSIDGGGILRKISHVMLPTIRPLIVINFVGAFIGAFHAMQNIFVMTGGGPINATMVIGIDIWYNAFVYLKFGYSTALAWVLGAGLIGFTLVQMRILKKVEFTAAASN